MEDKKTSQWWKVICKGLLWLGIIILVVFVIPSIINYLILQPAQFDIVGKDTDWLAFWGGYLGAIISAAVAFVILAIQNKQNHLENKSTRNLQISILEYQNKKEQLAKFISTSAKLISSINPTEVKLLCYRIGEPSFVATDEFKAILAKITNCYQEFCLYFNDDNARRKELSNNIKNIVQQYTDTISDIINILFILSASDERLTVEILKQRYHTIEELLSEQLQQVLVEFDTDITSDRISEFQSLAIKRLDLSYDAQKKIHGIIEPYIREEEKRILQFIRKDN